MLRPHYEPRSPVIASLENLIQAAEGVEKDMAILANAAESRALLASNRCPNG